MLHLGVHQDQQVFLGQAAFQLICEVIPSQVQGFSFPFVDINEFAACTFFQPVQLPLYGSTVFQSTSHLPWFYMDCELAESALSSSPSSLKKALKYLSPSSSSLKKAPSSPGPWGKALVTDPQLGLEHSALAAYQAIPLATFLDCSSSVCL